MPLVERQVSGVSSSSCVYVREDLVPSDFVQALPLCVSCNPRVCTHAVRATVFALRASVAVPCGARLWPGPPCLHPFGAVILQVWKPHTLAHIHRASGCCGHQSDAVGMLRLSPGFLCSAMRHRPVTRSPMLTPLWGWELQGWKPHAFGHAHYAVGCCTHMSDAVGMLRRSPGF